MWKSLIVLIAGLVFIGLRYAGPKQASSLQFAAQCQVLDDYLNHHGSDYENLDVDYYVRRSPIWVNVVPPAKPNNPRKYSIDQIEILSGKIKDYFDERNRSEVAPTTWTAFQNAQKLEFSWADCAFDPPLLTRESAAGDATRTQKRASENNIKDEASWREYKDNADKESDRYNFEEFRDDWREPRKRDGRIFFYGVSRIGINPAGDEAVFYLENTCQGTNCGTAIMVVMHNFRGTWKTRDFIMSSTFRRD